MIHLTPMKFVTVDALAGLWPHNKVVPCSCQNVLALTGIGGHSGDVPGCGDLGLGRY